VKKGSKGSLVVYADHVTKHETGNDDASYLCDPDCHGRISTPSR